MPKNIVLLSDGTDQDELGSKLTNIGKLFYILEELKQKDSNVSQVHYYDRGVGTEGYLRVLGSTSGYGIAKNIRDLYKFLVTHYQPGDKIFIFGFSRGATTARSLAGMIRNVGILKKENLTKLKEAYNTYNSSDDVDSAAADNFRKNYSYAFNKNEKLINFLGVYDTVEALGIPGWRWDDKIFFGFYDLKLSKIITVARHALSIDEKRNDFVPTLWEPSDYVDSEQRWFAGIHSDIGGSYQHRGLADITYSWMMTEAFKQGLEYPEDRKKELEQTYENFKNTEEEIFYSQNLKEELTCFVSNDLSSDSESDLDENQNNNLHKNQLSMNPNWNDKKHSERIYFRTHHSRPINAQSDDETMDLSVIIRRDNRDKKEAYAPPNLSRLKQDDITKLINNSIITKSGRLKRKFTDNNNNAEEGMEGPPLKLK